jgi:hypothetical protein
LENFIDFLIISLENLKFDHINATTISYLMLRCHREAIPSAADFSALLNKSTKNVSFMQLLFFQKHSILNQKYDTMSSNFIFLFIILILIVSLTVRTIHSNT